MAIAKSQAVAQNDYGRFAAAFQTIKSNANRGHPDWDDFSSKRQPNPSFCSSMIFSENRCPLFRIML
jgi:hypothetical protein